MKQGILLLVFLAGIGLGSLLVRSLPNRSANRESGPPPASRPLSRPAHTEVSVPSSPAETPAGLDWRAELVSATRATPAFLSALQQIPESQFNEAGRLILSLQHSSLRTLGLQILLERWAPFAPPDAAAFAENISDDDLRKRSVRTVLEEWVAFDRFAPSSWIKTSRSPSQLATAESYLLLLAEKSFPDAMQQAQLLVDAGLRRDLLRRVLNQWAKEEPANAAAWSHNLPPGERTEFLRDTLVRWAEKNPLQSVAFFSGETDKNVQQRLIEPVAIGWAKQDPQNAFLWLTNLPPGPGRSEGLRQVFRIWAASDPVSALAASAAVSGAETGNAVDLVRIVSSEWARNDPNAALSWALTVPDESRRGVYLADLLGRYAEQQPSRAAELVASIPPGPDQKKAAMDVLQRWSRADGTAAASWASEFPDGELRDEAVYTVARHWAFQAPDATAQWLEKIPEGKTRDAGITAFVATMDGSQPDLATRWATQIQDPKLRVDNVASAARRWLTANPDAARDWIQANLDPRLQNRILNPKP